MPQAAELLAETDERIVERSQQARAWMERDIQEEGLENRWMPGWPVWHPGEGEPAADAGYDLEPEL